jgi:hypothetical protein
MERLYSSQGNVLKARYLERLELAPGRAGKVRSCQGKDKKVRS